MLQPRSRMSRQASGILLALSMFSGIACPAQAKDIPVPIGDMSKMAIEAPVKSLLINTRPDPGLSPLVTEKKSADNYVKPGLVNWHQSLSEATRHAQESKKPVLVFHMMGSLDDRFC